MFNFRQLNNIYSRLLCRETIDFFSIHRVPETKLVERTRSEVKFPEKVVVYSFYRILEQPVKNGKNTQLFK